MKIKLISIKPTKKQQSIINDAARKYKDNGMIIAQFLNSDEWYCEDPFQICLMSGHTEKERKELDKFASDFRKMYNKYKK